MKNTILLLLILSISFISCKNEASLTEINPIQNKIDELGNRYHKLNRFSGTILVVQEDSIVYNSNFGLADYETSKPFTDKSAFKIGSTSELITKNIIEKLVIDGKVKLNDTISKHIPELNINFAINDLLNHNTNFPSIISISERNPELTYDTLTFANLVNDSITGTEKSNLNYNILGILIETITNKSFQNNIEDYSKSLKLENTFYIQPNSEIASGYQYHNYRNKGRELQKTESYNLNMAFSSNGIKSTAKDLVKITKHNFKDTINNYGYTENDGFSYSITNNKKDDLSIIVLSNYKQPITIEISNSIQSILNDKPYQLPLARQAVEIDKKLLTEYIGQYALNKYVNFKVITKNDSLFTILGPNEVHLIPQSNNQFYMQDRDAAMRFLKNTSDKVNRVELLDGFIDGQIANRINE